MRQPEQESDRGVNDSSIEHAAVILGKSLLNTLEIMETLPIPTLKVFLGKPLGRRNQGTDFSPSNSIVCPPS